jgi:hypothetical protein
MRCGEVPALTGIGGVLVLATADEQEHLPHPDSAHPFVDLEHVHEPQPEEPHEPQRDSILKGRATSTSSKGMGTWLRRSTISGRMSQSCQRRT